MSDEKTGKDVKKKEAIKKKFYVVSPGKCLTSKKGLKANGDAITAEDLAGGQEALLTFVKLGYIGEL
jgi:hypothetical protein